MATSAKLSIPPTLSFTSPTPTPSPVIPRDPSSDALQTPPRSSNGSTKGKRKAEDVEGNTPPDVRKEREQKATFAVAPRPLRASNATTVNSIAPSSYHRQKRARLSTPSESRPGSRSGTGSESKTDPNETSATIGSWSSRKSMQQRPQSRSQSLSQQSRTASLHRASSRRSVSQSSIPISALVSPHAPSIALSGRGSAYHMRDPHKPPRVQPTSWALSIGEFDLRVPDRWRRWTESGGSPLHAWLFFIGFIIFPVWWAASLMRVLRTRRIGHGSKGQEAQVVLDDPQVEFDARTWRTRCRIMAAISFFTYIPFVVLVAVFARSR
ncbi:hypothetical protein GGX14DRAFT_349070 [Mycena pura]|uniref:Uncharacterized protein n=1 Tax=Mycena pura TaxID=153505 RepID=A0AAD7E384_9AGAR|nr:hypothetical protein GGX14DRAFT_349070 [Mycena pura]